MYVYIYTLFILTPYRDSYAGTFKFRYMAHGIAYRRNASSDAEALVPVRVSTFTYVLAHTPSMQHAYMHTYMHTAGTLSIGTSRTALRAGGCRSTCAGESFEFHICTCTFPKHGARIHAYMQTCIHTYIHTYIRAFAHTHIRHAQFVLTDVRRHVFLQPAF